MLNGIKKSSHHAWQETGGIVRMPEHQGETRLVEFQIISMRDQTYAIHDSPSVTILCFSLDSGKQTTSTGRRISSSNSAVRV